MQRRSLPSWAKDLPKDACDQLSLWRNPAGYDRLGTPGGKKRRGQEILMEAGLMVPDPSDTGLVRLAGRAAAMRLV
jgi:hypothetical protein